ncbi:MAG TPA: rhomboid family intramembrane serine protease [Thermoanaerobaculia bacterium]
MIPIRDTIPSRHVPVATWSLIAVNLIAFFWQLTLPPAAARDAMFLFGIVPARFTDPAWAAEVGFPRSFLPFLTTMFLHSGWLHVIGNMWVLWIFGDNVEDRMGPLRFLVFYLACGISAGLIHVATNAGSRIPAVGASGAIAGVMAAYFVLYPRAQILAMFPIFFWPIFFHVPAWVYLGFWFLVQFFSGAASFASGGEAAGIAWWAHIGGFAFGILTFWAFLRRDRPAPVMPA